MARTHTYFVSDAHLGVDLAVSSLDREKALVSWLDKIKDQAKAIFLVGDIFDHWYEYKKVVPKGHVRLLGKLAALCDEGVEITFIKGNHDMWIFDYFTSELGVKPPSDSSIYKIDGHSWYITHGDGLDPSDKSYLFLKKILRNKFCQELYALVPPRLGLPLMKKVSGHSRDQDDDTIILRHTKMKAAATRLRQNAKFDYFVCGHLHAPLLERQEEGYTYCNLGDWMNHFTYGVWDGSSFSIQTV